MKKPTWIIHYIQEHDCQCCGKHNDEENPFALTGFGNYHTHGFNLYDHEEICVPFDLPQPGFSTQIGMVINSVGFRIMEEHEVFVPGKYATVLANDFNVEFYKPAGSPILYMLLPDPQNRLPSEPGCEFPYNQQMKFVDIIEQDKGYV